MFRLSLPDQLVDDLKKAAEKTLSSGSPVHIFSHYDADGVSSASILGLALSRASVPFQIGIIGEISEDVMKRIRSSEDSLFIFSDIGSGDADRLQSLGPDIIILDHHAPLDGKFELTEINAHRYGIDGTREASGSTMAYLFALALNEDNMNLAHLSLSGSTGDRQNIGGFTGINRNIAELGVENGVLNVSKGLNLPDLPIKDSIAASYSPFFRGISGRVEKAEKLVKDMGLDPETKLSELDERDEEKLASMLMIKLIEQGCREDVADELIVWRYTHVASALRIDDISSFLDAAVREDAGIAVAAGMGDEEAILRSKQIRSKHRAEIMNSLLTLEKSGARQMKNIQWFWAYSREVSSAQTGIGMQYLLNQEKPAFGLSEADGGMLKISARGTRHLISRGLNLTEVCRAASEVGGKGGGHNIASGCTIPESRKKEFLQIADEIVGKQIH